MSTTQEVIVLTRLAGTQAFLAGTAEMGAGMEDLAIKTDMTAASMTHVTRRSYLMNQALFTVRRVLYGITLATLASGVMAVKWGWQFNSAMQQARVALGPLQTGTFNVNKELDYLFNFTKHTPFQFKDITTTFRVMYGGMRTLGISAETVNRTIRSTVDALAFAGRTSPGSLNRVSYALQHMAFQGHLTGQIVNQLGRDGIPMNAILRDEFHLTGEEIHNVGKLGIGTLQFLDAYNRWIETHKGFAGAAYRLSIHSFSGLFTTFKDNLSQTMGYLEKNIFARLQNRVVQMNSWFDMIQKKIRGHASAQNIVTATFGGGAGFIWHELITDLHLFFMIIQQIVTSLAHSKVFWASILTTLLALHFVLSAAYHILKDFGWAINILIPLFVTWVVWTKAAALWTGIMSSVDAVATTKIKDMTFAQFLMNGALRAYYLGIRVVLAAQGLWTVATLGYAKGANGQFRALTTLEKLVRRARIFMLPMITAIWEAVAATWAWTAALLSNPITWIIIGVLALTVGLVFLYFKWKAFRDIVNETAGFIWKHWEVIGLVFGPFIFILGMIIKHFQTIINLAKTAAHYVGKAFGWAGGAVSSVFHFGSKIFGLADGGTVTSSGSVLVGERGPELLQLPRGAQVTPLSPSGGGMDGLLSRINITLKAAPVIMNGQKVADIVFSEYSLTLARS